MKALPVLLLIGASTAHLISAGMPRAFLEDHCYDCHDAETRKGGLNLEALAPSFATQEERARWTLVFDRIERGEMPPAKKPRPPAEAQRAALDWIGSNIHDAEMRAHAAEGRTLARRLNRVEYQNTIRDLLLVNVDVQSLLPEDGAAAGFDNVDTALDVSAIHLEKYLEAADVALDAAIVKVPRPETRKQHITYYDADPGGALFRAIHGNRRQILALPDATVFTNEGVPGTAKVLPKFRAPYPGRYKFRLSAYAWQSDRPMTAIVLTGNQTGDHGKTSITQVFSAPPGAPRVFEWEEELEKGGSIRLMSREPCKGADEKLEDYHGPGLAVQWVEVEGPILGEWPPPSHTRLLGDVNLGKGTLADAEKILRNFLPRAFRRPVSNADVMPFLGFVRARLAKGAKFEDALRAGLRAVLASHDFLYLQNAPGPLNDFALVVRLAYFLWSSMPDDTLFALAQKHQLAEPATLRAQVERMLADPKASAFTTNFTGQWLKLRDMDATIPDKKLYPEFDEVLAWSMVRETQGFFDELLKGDLSVLNFVQSDFAILNSRLAEHYGIPGVDTHEFRKVALKPEWHRGGVLTQGALLKVTANGTNTSPVPRGAFVLARILGRPPPPSPKDVPAIDPDTRGATSMREQLERHRADVSCAVCHAKIDPPGSALESYDVTGRWREFYRKPDGGDDLIVVGERGRKYKFGHGARCETDGVLPNGAKFANIDEFKSALLADAATREQIVRAFAERLLVYATGHALDFADRAAVTQIVDNTRAKNHGLRSLIHEVVQSQTFLSK